MDSKAETVSNKIRYSISDFDVCPNCGSDDGYYRRLYISGWTRDIHTFDGEPENMKMFDHLNYSRESKYYYCLHCDKRICKV